MKDPVAMILKHDFKHKCNLVREPEPPEGAETEEINGWIKKYEEILRADSVRRTAEKKAKEDKERQDKALARERREAEEGSTSKGKGKGKKTTPPRGRAPKPCRTEA